MIRYIKYFLAAASILFFLPACNRDEIEYDKGEEPLTLALNKTSIELDVRYPDSEALVFTWTTGANAGTNAAIDYLLQIDRKGAQFQNGLSIDLGRRVYTHQYTSAQLNDVLLGNFAVTPGESVELEARVVALVASEKASDQITETVSFSVKSYQPVSATLYMIGSATSGGWSLDQATAMNAIPNEAGGFSFIGDLFKGDLKFVTTTDGFLPSYNRDANATDKLVYRQNDSDPDEQFVFDNGGNYRITLNIIDLNITIEELGEAIFPRYDEMFFVGDFTGWSFIAMDKDPFNPFVFRYGAILDGGGDRDFKFGTESGNWSNMLHPTIPNAPISHTEAMFDDTGDNKWILSSEQNNKAYKMEVDITEGKESLIMAEFAPYVTIYVIGSASPVGWSLDDRHQATMTQDADDFTYTWTGTLTEGEIKFKCSDDSSWDSDETHPWYMAPDFDVPVIADTDMILTSNLQGARGSDRKWIVQEAGNYKITIYQLTERIRFDKQ